VARDYSLGIIMKIRLVSACAATGIALMAFGATTASAEDANSSFDISPGAVLPGDSVSLSATCDHPDFTAPAWVESGALVPTQLTGQRGPDGVWRMTGTTTVAADVTPGPWSAMFQCGPGGDVAVAEFTVEAAKDPYAAIGIDDDEIKPGQEVRVAATCKNPDFVSSVIVSPVLTAPDLVREEGKPVDSVLFSMGRIAADAKPGTYPISFVCTTRKIIGEFTVVGDPTPAPVKAQIPVKPKGAADTGSLAQPAAAPASEDGSDVLLIGAGAAVLLAAGGAGVWAHRRRRHV
jgi:hypothetical protein